MNKLYAEIKAIEKKFKNFLSLHSAKQNDHAQRDIDNVVFSAKVLQISEFEFFQIAYAQWYGREIRESNLEYVFVEYMFEGTIPHYVRDLARKVFLLFHQGVLDPKKFNIDRPKPAPELRSAGIGYMIMLLIVLVIFCLLITDYAPYD